MRSRWPEIRHADVMGEVPEMKARGNQDQNDQPDGNEPEDDRRGETQPAHQWNICAVPGV